MRIKARGGFPAGERMRINPEEAFRRVKVGKSNPEEAFRQWEEASRQIKV
jgi:hypothetical protein